jgi:WD40 repeat protein
MELKITFFTTTIKSVFLPIAPSRMKNMKPISFTLCYLIMSLNLVAQAPRIVINPQGHSGKIHNLVFTPDGKRLISISEDKTIRIWSTKTGEQTKKFESQIELYYYYRY